MATITANTAVHAGPTFRERLATAFWAYCDRLARTEQVDRLNAMSDETLAAKGIRREDIFRYVHRDRIAF